MNEVSQCDIHVPVTLFDIPINAQVDTGATLSVISENLIPSDKIIKITPNTFVSLEAYGGKKVEDNGFALVPLTIGSLSVMYPVLIARNNSSKLLLGNDFIEEYSVILDPNKRALISPHIGSIPYSNPPTKIFSQLGLKPIPIPQQFDSTISQFHKKTVMVKPWPKQPSHSPLTPSQIQTIHQAMKPVAPKEKIKHLRLHKSVTIPPRSKLFFPIAVNNVKVFEPLQRVYTHHRLLLPHAIVENNCPLVMINPTMKPVKLHAQTLLGILRPVEIPLKIQKIQTSPTTKSEVKTTTLPVPDFTKIDIAPNLSESEKDSIKRLVAKYSDVFSWRGELGFTKLVEFEINTGDAPPIRQRAYRTSEAQNQILQENLDNWLEQGIIEPSTGDWSSPIVIVKKKIDASGKQEYRCCVDLRGVNALTKPFIYPLPPIDTILSRLRHKKYFTQLDACQGFYQIGIKKEDRDKTQFVCELGSFRYCRMPMGARNASSYYQKLMDILLSGIKNKFAQAYIDDVLVSSSEFKDHLNHIEEVFKRFRKANLKLKPTKCKFGYQQLSMFGHKVSAHGIIPDESNVEAILKLPVPTKLKELQSLLASFNYYRKYIKRFSKRVAPLRKLLQKGIKFKWTEKCEEAYKDMKTALTSAPVLKHFDPNLETVLTTDASTDGLGAELKQRHEDGFHPVCYISRSLTPAEAKWNVTDLELLAMTWATKKLKEYLIGLPFSIETDHCALCGILRSKKVEMSPKMTRMVMQLQEFQILGIRHIKGSVNHTPDMLSRLGHTPEREVIKVNNCEISQVCRQESDPYIADIMNQLRNGTASPRIAKKFKLIGNQLFCHNPGKINEYVYCLPKSALPDLLKAFHDDPLGGSHFGMKKTYLKIKSRFHIPNLKDSVYKYVQSCPQCQAKKAFRRKPYGKPLKIPIPGSPRRHWQIDVVGPVKRAASGNLYILSAQDYYSKYVEFQAVPDATAERVARFVISRIVANHGTPEIIQTDRGSNFTSDVIKCINMQLGSTHKFSTAYHPQSQGSLERQHGPLKTALAMYANANQTNWDVTLPLVQLAMNSNPHEAHGYSPFFVMTGAEPLFPVETNLPRIDFPIIDYGAHFKQIYDSVQRKLTASQEISRKNKERSMTPHTFVTGDLVLYYRPNRIHGLSPSLSFPYLGPFKIVKVLNDVNFEIELCSDPTRREVVHASKLKRFYPREPLVSHDSSSPTQSLEPVSKSSHQGSLVSHESMTPTYSVEPVSDSGMYSPTYSTEPVSSGQKTSGPVPEESRRRRGRPPIPRFKTSPSSSTTMYIEQEAPSHPYNLRPRR